MIEEKINFLFMLIEIVFGLIAILLIIWVYGFVRRNLGLDKQTKELKKRGNSRIKSKKMN